MCILKRIPGSPVDFFHVHLSDRFIKLKYIHLKTDSLKKKLCVLSFMVGTHIFLYIAVALLWCNVWCENICAG